MMNLAARGLDHVDDWLEAYWEEMGAPNCERFLVYSEGWFFAFKSAA